VTTFTIKIHLLLMITIAVSSAFADTLTTGPILPASSIFLYVYLITSAAGVSFPPHFVSAYAFTSFDLRTGSTPPVVYHSDFTTTTGNLAAFRSAITKGFLILVPIRYRIGPVTTIVHPPVVKFFTSFGLLNMSLTLFLTFSESACDHPTLVAATNDGISQDVR
jgi:hypothetical protein